MRFATRTFLISSLPFSLLLLGSFWAIQQTVAWTVRDGLLSSLRQTHASIARIRARGELHNRRFLRVLSENPSLKAGLQLLLAEPSSTPARLTVEDQLREMCENLGFDFLLVSNPEGSALAGVIRKGSDFVPMDAGGSKAAAHGFASINGNTYQVASTPIDQGDENLGILSVGEHFDFSEFSTPAVLTRKGRVVQSSLRGAAPAAVEFALQSCRGREECEVRIGNEAYISLPMNSLEFGDGYVLRSLQNADRASAPVQAILRNVFLTAGAGALLAALVVSFLSSRSIVRPIAAFVSHLKQSEQTGLLPELEARPASIQEIRDLTASFNQAAAAIREARNRLHHAYVEFTTSLANALDARDHYTAGHSRRVSEYSCAIAQAVQAPEEQLERIRVGALLHDIGKIGIADAVLQKPGKLTAEEFAIIREHPTIGRRILEAVQGFQPYLDAVELHHENWDGSGYPHGQKGARTPLDARIIHVADAYDAMTSDRPYRKGMRHEQAIHVLEQNAGSQFDAEIVAAFAQLPGIGRQPLPAPAAETSSIQKLAEAVGETSAGLPAREATP
ncbi:MAG: HD-GYP domain-containing protein [Bryobacterales bacterium]|nr:HD-GYP domain-containing protein [Bryobacterales bacterium]